MNNKQFALFLQDSSVLIASVVYSKQLEAWHWGVWRGDAKMGGWVDTFAEAWNALAPIIELNNFGKETP